MIVSCQIPGERSSRPAVFAYSDFSQSDVRCNDTSWCIGQNPPLHRLAEEVLCADSSSGVILVFGLVYRRYRLGTG